MNIAVLEQDLLKKTGEATALLEKTMRECQAFEEKDADGKVIAKGRLMSDAEKKDIQKLLDEGKALKARVEAAKSDASFSTALAELTAGMSAAQVAQQLPLGPQQTQRVMKSLGQQFVESEAYEWIKKTSGKRSSKAAWTSPSAELMAATLTTDAASGGDLIISDYRPGIIDLRFKRLVVADLIASGTTDSNSITYMKETTFTNAAATVAEGAAKPESTLVFDQISDLVQVIAHWLPVTEQMLEDVSAIRSYIDARLRLGVQLAEEDQLLNGDGTPPNISGILDRSGLATAVARGSDTNADAIFKQRTAIATTAFVDPTGVVINPTNWQTTVLAKDANGQYYGAGPFAGMQTIQTLWGLPVSVTPSIAAGTALVGDYAGSAQVFRKGGIRVEATNSHSDFFVKNLQAIRAEERLALAVYRPGAFGTVTGLA
jgi:HK97 family phage major capsid protein